MSDEERYQKYVEEHCSRCKNRDKYDCEIKIFKQDNVKVTKCEYYERQH